MSRFKKAARRGACGLILAAGESRRMGSPKALLDYRGETFLGRVIALEEKLTEMAQDHERRLSNLEGPA